MIDENTMTILNVDLLNVGIEQFKNNFSRQWDDDFHNQLYKDLQEITKQTISIDAWGKIFEHLKAWGALRGVEQNKT